MKEYTAVSTLPNEPAVYALYAGKGKRPYAVYVGHTKALKNRINQHLVARDSSINTATAGARLNPDCITEVRWWTSEDFARNGEAQLTELRAAELVAFSVLNPVLRSNAKPELKAQHLSEKAGFRRRMEELFNQKAKGRLRRRDADFILAELARLQSRLEKAESQLDEIRKPQREISPK